MRQQEGQLGLFRPESDWTRPAELPDLRGRPLVAIDLENKDDGLAHGLGPGWALGPLGYICGVAYAADGVADYAPVAHPESDCFELSNVLRWLDDLYKSGTRIVFHNAPYDCGWTLAHGVAHPVLMEDTLPAQVMLDENYREYSLDACCRRAGILGKDITLLAAATRAYGGVSKKPQADVWRVPARYAAPYAAADAVATLGLWGQSELALKSQDVWDAYRTEMELIPMTIAMRERGIDIDEDLALRTAEEFRAESARHLALMSQELGLRRVVSLDEIRTVRNMEQWCLSLDIQFPRTSGGTTGRSRGSFSKDWMEKHEHPFARAYTQALKFEEAASKFIDNFIFKFVHRGRIHSEIHQFLGEDGGTRSHRFSYSSPPLQQMTSPDKDPRDAQKNLIEDRAVGTKLRRLFKPRRGFWCASDYSQQEPRITVHYAAVCKIEGVEDALARYQNDPRTDYHSMVADMTGLPRPRAKILNLAMTYGKGKRSTAEELGVSLEEAEQLLKEYHERLPFIKPLEELCKRMAADRGFIRLIDGARMHYPLWEGGWIDWEDRKVAEAMGKKLNPCTRAEAELRRSDPEHPWSKTYLRRADTRKALNNLVQGSAARQTKRAMLEMWKQGIVPLLQMHDELDNDVESEEEVLLIDRIMRETTPLRVPIVVDSELGRSWGEAKLPWAKCVEKYGEPGRLAA